MARTVRLELTEAQAHALVRLAECSANTEEDAWNVLVDWNQVAAGYRAIGKLNDALYGHKAVG
jgi:hypothetical protein